ncbi:IS30 family transposase [Dokdonella sp.]|uniref:IS30 family transposase n=1 Tax=Dokdonella sp. TaxID=2291710 RepID=UPI00352753A4
MRYTHLSQYERYQIQRLFRAGVSIRWIARVIERCPSTVSRELRRNAGTGQYRSATAQHFSEQRRNRASAVPRISLSEWRRVDECLREGWSPDQIAGSGEVAVSHERIYLHIARDRQRGGSLWKSLRRRRKQRRNRCGKPRDRQRFGGRRIQERPAIVETRQRLGDWEGDTIVGKGRARIVTLVDRKSGLLRMRRVASGASDPTRHAILKALKPLMPRVHTLTWDNGSEFAEHALIDAALGATSFFADPFSAWQRGSNENTNG